MKLIDIFDQIQEQMHADLRKTRAALEHPGMKGLAFEDIFRGFLREYLPNSLDVSTGILIDADGNSSRQLDVIVSDAAKTPIFYRSETTRVIPVECAYAVIEVKANLATQDLVAAFENMHSVRSLQKRAFVKPSGAVFTVSNLYGQEWDIRPVMYFIFAFDSRDLAQVAAALDRMHRENSLSETRRIDTVCVLEKGVICNQLQTGEFNALPEPGSDLFTCETHRALLLFYVLMSRYLFQTYMPDFRITDYLGQLQFGPGDG
jgi:hypothetical protein